MKKKLLVGCMAILSAVPGYGQAASSQQRSSNSTAPSISTQRALLDQYCVTCHNEKAKAAGLAASRKVTLDQVDLAHVGESAEMWEKVVRKLRAGMMPPPGARRPDPATYEALTVWLENELDRSAAAKPNPGRVDLHRLNRAEYANAIRDLLAVEVDAAALLPSDDSSNGFDNMAGALAMTPALLEAYVSAAAKISRLAVGHWTDPTEMTYIPPVDTSQDYHIKGLPFGTRGGMLIRHTFPADGEYSIYIAGLNVGVTRSGEQLEVTVDGVRMHLFDWDKELVSFPGERFENRMETRIPVKAGTHTVGITFLAESYRPSLDASKHFLRSTLSNASNEGLFTQYPHVGFVRIRGPYNATGAKDLPSVGKIFVCRPASADAEQPCAEQIISTLARRAFRRPVVAEDLKALMGFYQKGRNRGSFEDGIEIVLQRILADPEFVYRIESEPASLKPGGTYRVSDLDLASRLSFFLWSSNPDDELINLAQKGTLRDPKVLEQQVRRMLADPRAQELVNNFAGQWLYLRSLPTAAPAHTEFPDWDDNLRQAFRTETEMLFESIMREDRNVLDLLTADYTFVNERLAKHYGIPNIYGSQFRRLRLGADNPRRGLGLLGHGSILTVTSLPNRTSPVQRGKWILQNILGTNPPDPPPNVPSLEKTESEKAGRVLSLREQMEAHRRNPACASCHKIMDPIGFSLENFDATGKCRTKDGGEGGTPIDASGQLFDGTNIDGPASLRQALLRYSPQFVRTVTEKLLTYALGRGVEYYDMPVVRSIVGEAARNDNRFSSLVLGIVKSAPFQMRMKMQESAVRE